MSLTNLGISSFINTIASSIAPSIPYFLGHVNIKTTEIDVKANLEMKPAVLEKVTPGPIPKLPSWKEKVITQMVAIIMKLSKKHGVKELTPFT